MGLPSVVIIGSGWAGFTLAHGLDDSKFNITVLSPEAKSPYTPLLASAACGLFDFSLAEQPVRRKSKRLRYIQASVLDVDFEKKVCLCSPAFKGMAEQSFEVLYDHLVMAPGCTNQTFGTQGVKEHALFVRNVHDAMAVRQRLHDILEMASLPNKTDQEQRDLLHIAVVGGKLSAVSRLRQC